jgi:citrate synthase
MMIAGLSAVQPTQMNQIPAHVGKNLYLGNPSLLDEQIINLMAVLPILTTSAYYHYIGRPLYYKIQVFHILKISY